MSDELPFERLLYVAEHLFQMVPREVWREHGAEWQGQYEGDYHAEQVAAELASYRAAIDKTVPDTMAMCECGHRKHHHVRDECRWIDRGAWCDCRGFNAKEAA
jgi:hypothetical protein